jgi:hypothetical protein
VEVYGINLTGTTYATFNHRNGADGVTGYAFNAPRQFGILNLLEIESCASDTRNLGSQVGWHLGVLRDCSSIQSLPSGCSNVQDTIDADGNPLEIPEDYCGYWAQAWYPGICKWGFESSNWSPVRTRSSAPGGWSSAS